MDKEEALQDFLKGFRIVLNTASAYSKDHPYYRKSVATFKQKIDALSRYLNPIKINVTPDSLYIDERFWAKLGIYVDLAGFFHLRKIEGIEISPGITVQELVDFLNCVSIPKREVIRKGGVRHMMELGQYPDISVKELDYSMLLMGEGEEAKDIWVYLFKESVDKADLQKINEYALNFSSIISKFKAKDIVDDDELRENIGKFLKYLKNTKSDKFKACAQDLFKMALRNKDLSNSQKIQELKDVFQDLSEDEFSDMLWKQLSADQNFDSLSFELFSRLSGKEKQDEIIKSFVKKAEDKEFLEKNKQAVKKAQELFSVSQDSHLSEVYRNTLSQLFKNISFESVLTFDRKALLENYRYILLGLFDLEKEQQRLGFIMESLDAELDKVVEVKDFSYLGNLLEILRRKRIEGSLLKPGFVEIYKRIVEFIENAVWDDDLQIDLEEFIDAIIKPARGLDFYIGKFFHEQKLTPNALRLFFRHFPQKMNLFLSNLSQRYSEPHFLLKVIDNLRQIDSPVVLEVLEFLFAADNKFIKIETLKAMRDLKLLDEKFLFQILKSKDYALRREAFAVLIYHKETESVAAEMIFSVRSLLGLKNNLLIENMMIVNDLDFVQASDYLYSFAKRRFFWNRKLRDKAKSILRKWNARAS
ncbi:MAG: hypothetical protein KJ880_00885 [Candidatus Omnitrophica bacterium]|nr:hypothetical protein [Candidatus Omnitrophota bacterium]MBU1868951.1 hypothetical protein [Candidatus Omnitrophota bacterium]